MPKFLQLSSEPPAGFNELMKNTLWGSEGGVRYLQRDIDERLTNQDESYFLSLIRGDRLIGTMNTYLKSDHEVEVYYIRYFSFLSDFQSTKPKSDLQRKGGIVRQEINSLFRHGSLRTKGDPASFIAFVESENERSRHMCETFGFSPRRTLSTKFFSRLKPQDSDRVRLIREEEITSIRTKLDDYYRGYNLHNTKEISSENYFILEEDGKCLCGARVLPAEWKIVSIPGLWGWTLTRVLPRLPYLRKILDPGFFRFLAVDQIYLEKGSESLLNELLEAICKQTGYHFILSWADSESSINSVLAKLKKGFIGNFQKNIKGQIIFRHSSVDPEVIHKLEKRPMYIDPRDMT